MHGAVPMNRRDLFRLAGKLGLVALAQQVPWSWLERAGLVAEHLAEAAIPQNMQLRAPTALYDASTGLSGLLGSGKNFGSGTVTVTENADPSFIRTPGLAKNIKVVVDSTAGVTVGYLDIAMNRSFSDIHQWGHWCYISDTSHMGQSGTSDGVNCMLATDAGLVNRYEHYILTTNGFGVTPGVVPDNWNFVGYTKNPNISSGAPNYNSTQNKMRLRFAAQSGYAVTFYVESVLANYWHKPVVMLSFDDNPISLYDEWTAYLHDRDVRGTLVWSGEKQGNPSFMSADHANEMYEAGWSVCTHGMNHQQYAAESVAYTVDQYGRGLALLQANGWTRDLHAATFPQGSYSENVRQALVQLNITEGYGTYTRIMPQVYGLEYPGGIHLPRTSMDAGNGLSVTTIKQYIDRALSTGGLMHLYTHDILVGASGLQMERDNFRQVIDYLVRLRDANQILLLTFADYRSLRNGGRKRRGA